MHSRAAWASSNLGAVRPSLISPTRAICSLLSGLSAQRAVAGVAVPAEGGEVSGWAALLPSPGTAQRRSQSESMALLFQGLGS